MSVGKQFQNRKDFAPPSPEALMSRYLRGQAEVHAAGLTDVPATSEVQLYEAGPVQPIDAKLAWDEAVAVASFMVGRFSKPSKWKALPSWPQLVAGREPAFDLAFCLGNFPQLVRNLHPLLHARDLSELRRSAVAEALNAPALEEWAENAAGRKQFPEVLLAVAGLRLAKQFDRASTLIEQCEKDVPEAWQEMWTNEKAALAWHRGDWDQARRLWQQAPESVPVLFNRGMAALFSGEPDVAKKILSKVVDQLPENSAWHHLARLYLTLAETRRG